MFLLLCPQSKTGSPCEPSRQPMSIGTEADMQASQPSHPGAQPLTVVLPRCPGCTAKQRDTCSLTFSVVVGRGIPPKKMSSNARPTPRCAGRASSALPSPRKKPAGSASHRVTGARQMRGKAVAHRRLCKTDGAFSPRPSSRRCDALFFSRGRSSADERVLCTWFRWDQPRSPRPRPTIERCVSGISLPRRLPQPNLQARSRPDESPDESSGASASVKSRVVASLCFSKEFTFIWG